MKVTISALAFLLLAGFSAHADSGASRPTRLAATIRSEATQPRASDGLLDRTAENDLELAVGQISRLENEVHNLQQGKDWSAENDADRAQVKRAPAPTFVAGNGGGGGCGGSAQVLRAAN